jgi:rhamnogalacturonyl hydrolase YesR
MKKRQQSIVRLMVVLWLGTLSLSCAALPGEQFLEVTDDGGWCWFADPRAVTRDGKTYAGWVTEDGSVQAAQMDHITRKVSTVTLHEKYQRDDHDNPSFLFLPDGRLMAFYSTHAGPEMNCRVTARAGDFSEWRPERVLELHEGLPRPRKSITYPNPVMLSAENNTIYLFWRGDTWKPMFSKSTDAGQTWSPATMFVSRSGAKEDWNRPYVKVASNGRDRIHLIFTDGHPRNEASNNVYYACYRAGAFYRADGTRICGVEELPFTPEQADLVYDARKTGVRAWVWDVAADEGDRPVIAYTRLPAENDHRYHYARWTGKEWFDKELCAGGGWFPQTPAGQPESEPHYSGGLVLDHANPGVVYLSRPVNGVREIERWQTTDIGRFWLVEAVTRNSKQDNVRPFIVRNHTADGPKVLWENISGHYVRFIDYRTSIKSDPRAAEDKPPPLSAAIKPAAILAAMERVADWQLASPSRWPPTQWTQAAGYAGLMALSRISRDSKYFDAMLHMGESNQWKLHGGKYIADDHAIGQTYAELILRSKDPRMIAPMRAQFDDIIAHPFQRDTLQFNYGEALNLWSWCDALFMAPPAWTRLYRATGDQKYLDYSITNWWRTSDYLYDPEEHLYFRDSTYFKKREANGKKMFWSRGNGWVMGGLARVLQDLPKDHPQRARFEAQFREMAEKILTCQQRDGLWRSSLLDPASYPLKETSGSGFYTYALAWGVNEGLLDRAKFVPAVQRAWAALVGCVTPDGKLTHVQPVGADPKRFPEDATEVYGVGAFLLAGSEVYQLADDKPPPAK